MRHLGPRVSEESPRGDEGGFSATARERSRRTRAVAVHGLLAPPDPSALAFVERAGRATADLAMRPGTQVWAKVEGYRWWPAVVLDPADHRDEMRDAPKMPDRSKPVLVRFHHTEDLGFMAPSKVLDFAAHVREKSAGGKKGGGFAQAVAAAKAALGMGTDASNGTGDDREGGGSKKPKPPADGEKEKDAANVVDARPAGRAQGKLAARTPRNSENVETGRPRRQAATAGEEQRREGPKVIPGELGAAAGYLHGAASRAQERAEAGLADGDGDGDEKSAPGDDASSGGGDASSGGDESADDDEPGDVRERAARLLGGFAATAADANSASMDEIAARVDDFERSMRWYMGVDDPKEAGVVAGLGVHLSEVGVIFGKAASDDYAAEEGHHGRIAKNASKTADAVAVVTADANAAGSTRRASKRDAAAAATDAIVGGGGGPAAAVASKNAKDASDAAREHAKRAREASNAAVAASNWGTGTGTGTKSRHPGTKSRHPGTKSRHPGTTSDGSPPTGRIADAGGADGSTDDASPRKTKACHQCGRRHVPRYECKNRTASAKGAGAGVTCGASYCDGCVRRHYPRRYRDGPECPKCSGQCVCRACLRDPIPPPAIAPHIPRHRLRGLYEDLVESCAPALRATAEREAREMAADAECAATRDSHEDALDASAASGWRLFCDQCGGAVANLHRSCWACEVDLCVECCSDLRAGRGVGSPGWKSAGGAPAATPASALVGAKGGAGHDKRTRDRIEQRSTDDSKPAERPSETELAALPVKKRLKLAAIQTDSDAVVSNQDVSNAAKSSGIKVEPDASVKVEVGVESSPCAEPLLCVRCTRPMELRSCVERKWLDRIYKSSRYLRAVEKLEKERRGEWGEDDGVVATTKKSGGVLSMKARDERCPWCSAFPVGSSDVRDCGAGGLVWCPRTRDLRDAGADGGADAGADGAGEDPGTFVTRATPTDPDALRHFRWHWARGEPIVVREIEVAGAGADWSLETLERALRDGDDAAGDDATGGGDTSGRGATRTCTDRMVPVVDACKEWGAGVRSGAVAEAMTVGDFFKGFADARTFGPDATYRMDGWPSEADLRARAPRHRARAIAGLPFQEYTNPVDGPMNLRTHVSANAGGATADANGDGAFGAGGSVRTRIAYGRREEIGGAGDAVSQRLRTSSVDTAEVLCLALSSTSACDKRDDAREGRDGSYPDGVGRTGDESPGAVWHVFRREHEGHIARYLSENLPVLAHPPDGDRRNHHHRADDSANDRALAARLPLHDGRCFLSSNEIDELGRESGGAVKPWVIRQARFEAVMVPAGCARQTRNVKSCVALAVDFASPESAVTALRVGEAMRELPVKHAERTREGVHARTTVLHAAHAAVTRLEAGE